MAALLPRQELRLAPLAGAKLPVRMPQSSGAESSRKLTTHFESWDEWEDLDISADWLDGESSDSSLDWEALDAQLDSLCDERDALTPETEAILAENSAPLDPAERSIFVIGSAVDLISVARQERCSNDSALDLKLSCRGGCFRTNRRELLLGSFYFESLLSGAWAETQDSEGEVVLKGWDFSTILAVLHCLLRPGSFTACSEQHGQIGPRATVACDVAQLVRADIMLDVGEGSFGERSVVYELLGRCEGRWAARVLTSAEQHGHRQLVQLAQEHLASGGLVTCELLDSAAFREAPCGVQRRLRALYIPPVGSPDPWNPDRSGEGPVLRTEGRRASLPSFKTLIARDDVVDFAHFRFPKKR